MQTKTTKKHTLKLWREVTLGEICEKIQDGTHFSPKTIEEGRYKYITSKNIRMGKLDLTNMDYLSEADHNAIYSRCRVAKGDVLLTKDGANTGNVCINPLDEEFSLLSSVAFMRADSSQADNKYIYQWLASDRTQYMIHDSMAGQAITRITLTKLNDYPLLLPPLPEQNRIVAVLETWDRAIEKLTKKIEVKKQVKKGLMQELLTGKTRLKGFSGKWEKMKIKNIGEVVTGNTPPKKNPDYYGDKYLWATAFDFNGVYIEDTKVKLSESGAQVARIVRKGSVLVTCIASIGKNAIAKKEMGFNQQINAIIPHKNFSSEFIYYLIEGSFHKLKEVAGGGALAMISKGVFETITLDFPKIDEQTAVADILTTADNEITTLETKLTLLKDQKKYLLNNLITGEIRTPENLTLYS